TALFYASLHLAEAYFALDPAVNEEPHYVLHVDRDPAIRRRLPRIHDPYTQLKIASEAARYRCMRYVPTDVDRARHNWYEPLKAMMTEMLDALRNPATPRTEGEDI